MTKPDPQERLEELIRAFQNHYQIAIAVEDDEDDELSVAEEALEDAFFRYDNALFSVHGVELPFDIYDDDDDEEDDDDDYVPGVAFDDEDDEFEVYEIDEDDEDED